MRKKMRKMMRKIASVHKMMRKMVVFMCKIMRKMKISSSMGEHLSKILYAMLSIGVKVKYSRSEQHKTFKFHLLAQNINCLSN